MRTRTKILPPVCSVVALLVITADGTLDTGFIRNKRDTDIIGEKLRIVTVQNEPYTYITYSSSGQHFSGFIPDIIELLSKKFHFSYEFYESPDGKFGTEQPDGSWNGMIGQLLMNKHDSDGKRVTSERSGADLIAAPLTMTSKRQKVVDFVHPFHNLGLTILVKKANIADDGSDVSPFDFSILKPFTASVWAMIILFAIVVAIFLCLLNYFNPYEWGGRHNLGLASVHQKDSFTLSGAFWFVFSTLQWQGFERAPRAISSKVLTCFWFAFVTLTLVTYIGGLINQLWWSTMTFRHVSLGHPIKDLEDLVSRGGRDFKYGVIANGFTYTYITEVVANSKAEFQQMKRYWQTKDGKQQLVDNLKQGLNKVRTEKYALIMQTMTARWEVNQEPCDLTTVGPQFGVRSYGLAVPKNWPYLDLFHQGVMELNDEGVIDQLEEKWWEGRGDCWNQTQAEKDLRKADAIYLNQAKPKTIDLQMFRGQLILMVIGFVITCLTAAAEIFYYRYKGKYDESSRPRDQSLALENENA